MSQNVSHNVSYSYEAFQPEPEPQFTDNRVKNMSNRIYGGVNVDTDGKYPFLVYLRSNSECTGSLIGTDEDNAWVLTAKHCIDNEQTNTKYYLCGQTQPCKLYGCGNFGPKLYRLAAKNSQGLNHIILRPSSRYPDIQVARKRHFKRELADLALIKLESLRGLPCEYSFGILSDMAMSPNEKVSHLGYGLNDRMGAGHPPFSFNARILRHTDSKLKTIDYRYGAYSYSRIQTYIVDPNEEEGIRQGDSGGPIVYPVGHPRENQIVAVHNWINDRTDPISETGSASLTETATYKWIREVVYMRPPSPPNPPAPPSPAQPDDSFLQSIGDESPINPPFSPSFPSPLSPPSHPPLPPLLPPQLPPLTPPSSSSIPIIVIIIPAVLIPSILLCICCYIYYRRR
tara:strand:- start:185 stop:1381 length:1197 start_codon:yes stop_codon:yes gene_type:complete